MNTVHGTIHCRSFNHLYGNQLFNIIRTDVSSDFHLYQLEWTPNSIRIYRDNQFYFRYDKPALPTYQNWPFDNQFDILINSAVGGDWGGAMGIDDSIFPQVKDQCKLKRFTKSLH
jgi:beta-glucanase (GH16 family)